MHLNVLKLTADTSKKQSAEGIGLLYYYKAHSLKKEKKKQSFHNNSDRRLLLYKLLKTAKETPSLSS